MTFFRSRAERIRLERKKYLTKLTLDIIVCVLIALVVAIVIRIWLYEPVHVSGASMQDTMRNGSLVMVNKWIYLIRQPERGEVIVFHAKEKKDYIKRVIALPGETVEAKNNKIWINGEILEEPYISDRYRTLDFPLTQVPSGMVFVLGDNRSNSLDSRVLGPIPISSIVGRADLIYWPITDIKILW